MRLRRSLLLDRHAVEFQPVIHQPVAEALGDGFLQGLDLGVDEFDDLAGLHVDQMIVALQEAIAKRLGYKLVDHRLELYGMPIEDK